MNDPVVWKASRWSCAVKANVRCLMGPPSSQASAAQAEVEGGCSPPPLSCRVSHGANDGFFHIEGRQVASIRRFLATPFNIPDDADAIINGVHVDPQHRPWPGDHLLFVVRWGWKGTLEPHELARLARIEERLAKIEASLAPEWVALAKSVGRIADHFDPPPPDKVDTSYIASLLGVGAARVAQMALGGEIPGGCIVPGTGQGKPWKFFRSRIDLWIESR